ncbi:MAG: YdcF family protein [Candidatus Shapirobacteria bacterium]|jgi:uncharacterized SAM-binding protein YcdF (DUF218 family)
MPDSSLASFSDDELARILWDYNNFSQDLSPSDCILVLGNNDIRVASYAADLYLAKLAPLIIMSGGYGAYTRQFFTLPEAEVFAREAISRGVPKNHILVENQSTNTGENLLFTQKLLASKEVNVKSVILVQKPYMLRRAYATFKKQWPGVKVLATGPSIGYFDYPNSIITKERLINHLVGDTQRVKLYPKKGFQVFQKVPIRVWAAYKELVRRGYDQHLIPST